MGICVCVYTHTTKQKQSESPKMTEVITNITLACVTTNLNTFDSFLKRQSLSDLIKKSKSN